MTKEQIDIYKQIDEILWEDWDPIGVNDFAPRNEYYGYLPEIFKLKIEGANKETIAKRLEEIVVNRMGLSSNMERNLKVAEKIINAE